MTWVRDRPLLSFSLLGVLLSIILLSSRGDSHFGSYYCVAVVLIIFACSFLTSEENAEKLPAECRERSDVALTSGASFDDPLRWAFLSSTGSTATVHRANTQDTVTSENDMCSLHALAMHRPTHEPWRELNRDYPYSWHLAGRKRIWEIRIQIRFKQLPKGTVYFGLEFEPGSTSSISQRNVQKMLLRIARQILGNSFYQSGGDDPASTVGEVEPGTVALPLWFIDQFHVADPGEQPDITSDLESIGVRRTDGLQEYKRALDLLFSELSTERIYTFCIWGVSRFADVNNWELVGLIPGIRTSVEKLCGESPLKVAVYDLVDSQDTSEQRHLESRKRYYFKVALWSMLQPRPRAILEQLGIRYDSDASVGSKLDGKDATETKLATFLMNRLARFAFCSCSGQPFVRAKSYKDI